MSKKNIMLIVGFVVVAVVSFYAGGSILGSKSPVASPTGPGQFGQGRGMRAGGGNVFGQIIAKDASSITVEIKTPAGPNGTTPATTGTGSKIVFYTDTTTVTKTTAGTAKDLTIGTNVVVAGTANSDGSVSATSVQIR